MNEEYFNKLSYDPKKLKRELKKYYIASTKEEQKEMLDLIKLKDFKDLFLHIPEKLKFTSPPFVSEELNYTELISDLESIASRNNLKTCFIGDGLKNYKVGKIIPYVSNLRGLTTAYTPYQPERSQGTLQSIWIYSSVLSMLTGFEAISASLYDRSTAIFEAIQTSMRIIKGSNVVLICESIYPDDIEVIKTLSAGTSLRIITVPIDPITGTTDLNILIKIAKELGSKLSGIIYPQVNNLGNLEDVHLITDLCWELNVQAIAIIDPMLLATKGLVSPVDFGTKKQGAHMIVGEGQHLAIGPNFGGPGLGIFGIRYNQNNKDDIRSTAGRFIGKTKDAKGNECLCMVLSTREQHIRREKATSNICSNQSFIATLAGASILERGEKGTVEICQKIRMLALFAAKELTKFKGVNLAFPSTSFYNEFTLELPVKVKEVQRKALLANMQLGIDVSERLKVERNLLLLSFFDIHSKEDIEKIILLFETIFDKNEESQNLTDIPTKFLRSDEVCLPNFKFEELKEFYQNLSDLNLSPDDHLYPLGSCTMKYNPYINDYAASLRGFTDIHPQAPIQDVQGCLEILYNIQEMFKSITGLAGVTTQPVAGAQGELVGIKLFQAYHKNNGEGEIRNILLIPKSAHGTNPATAAMAGFETKVVDGIAYGIITIEADQTGQIDFNQMKQIVEKYNKRIAGIMVTNPNTSGIFEINFREIADLIHSVGGLVYMDGANMNAIAGWIDLNKMGVDAVHNNLHKTWSIPHGGGGPGDAIVAVSEKLVDYLPGFQIIRIGDSFDLKKNNKSIGSFHRHFGNFAHKIRTYTYLRALGGNGVREMSAVAVLSSRYLFEKFKLNFLTLPLNCENEARMHEFILTFSKDTFDKIEKSGTPKSQAISKIGKLFLDFGIHAPTVAFPEVYGLMIEPTESYTKEELDHFVEIVNTILHLVNDSPQILQTAPHFTPIRKVDEVEANRILNLMEHLNNLPKISKNTIHPEKLFRMHLVDICKMILKVHEERYEIKK